MRLCGLVPVASAAGAAMPVLEGRFGGGGSIMEEGTGPVISAGCGAVKVDVGGAEGAVPDGVRVCAQAGTMTVAERRAAARSAGNPRMAFTSGFTAEPLSDADVQSCAQCPSLVMDKL